ncbi:oligosaccharide flippase family protein [Altibacter sp. HG106]|uniref:oligosaccharide flippase family protein n=1 Tax=Altibacter sp. HG106 TaxID=3023937 RepID=UPI002350EEBA|nr:oligosaccharide flippase family protein [Altibacter sp. HG106]MDC7995005.1 oligosaccharide flippase family protein [Altibacter sp. HG106]
MFKAVWKSKSGRTIIENYTALLFIQGANFLLPLISLPYLVRTLGPEKYGLVMIAQAVGVFLTVIVDFGFNISATREVSLLREDKKKLSQFFWNVFLVKGALLVVAFGIVALLVSAVPRFQADPWVYLLSFIMVIGHAIFPTWFFQGIEKMRVITIINVLAKGIFTASIFLVVLNPQDYLWVPICYGGGFVLAGVIGLLYSLKYIHWVRPKVRASKALVVESSSLFVSNFSTSLYASSNTFILGMIGGEAIAGVYASMEKLILAIKNVYVPLYQAIFPWLAKKKLAEVRAFVRKLRVPVLLSSLFLAGLIYWLASDLLHFVYDDTFIESYSGVLQLLGLIAVFSSLNMLFLGLYFPAIKNYKQRMFIMMLAGGVNLVLAIIGGLYFGIYGVATSAVVTEAVMLVVAYLRFRKDKKAV